MKNRTGSLIKRASGYYVSLMVDGVRIVRALKNPDGTPSKTIQEARRAQADFARVFALGNKADSLQAIVKRLADVQTEIDEIESPKATVAGCWEAYLKSPDKLGSGAHTEKAYCQYTRDFVRWTQERYPKAVFIPDVTRAIAGEYAAHLTALYSGVTFNKHLMFLKVLCRVLCEDLPNPFIKIKNKPVDSISHKPLSPEQIKAVLGKANGELHTLLLVGTYTALRLGDACQLKWEQVDLEKGLITVTPSKTASRSHKRVVIPIHPQLRDTLSTMFHKSDFVLPYIQWRYSNDRSSISKKIRLAMEAAGIVTQGTDGDRTGVVYSYHSFRYSMGQALVSSGYTVDQVGFILGHTSNAMSRHYSSITDAVRDSAIHSLPNIISA